uniref:G-protein coupled receptors family 2 profile 2 domain-containing protein n=1 Tax=Clytia hemisphaerica TaxID=252671 RepID=A0A7M5XH26_9CNID
MNLKTLLLLIIAVTEICRASNFPVNDFLEYLKTNDCGIDKLVDNINSTFANDFLCSARNVHVDSNRTCSCNITECVYLRTCCIDIVWDKHKPISLTDYIDYFIDKVSLDGSLSCESIIPRSVFSKDGIISITEYFMVSACPGQTHQSKNDDFQPVIDSQETLYKSRDTALCNGVTKYHPATIEIHSLMSGDISEIKRGGLYNLTMAMVKLSDRSFKHKCKKTSKHVCSNDLRYLKFRQLYRTFLKDLPGGHIRWSLMISVVNNRLQMANLMGRTITKTCQSGQSFNLGNLKCTQDACMKPYQYHNGSCILDLGTVTMGHDGVRLPWQRQVDDIEKYVTMFIMPLSICGYIWSILGFLYFKELQNLPRLNSICMTCALFIGDTMFYVTFHLGENAGTHFCQIHAIIVQWAFLCAMMWAFLTATELALVFNQNAVIPSKIDKRRFSAYLFFAVSVPLVFVLLTHLLDSYGILKSGIGINGICWMTEFKSRLYFYIIPIGIGYALSMFALGTIILSLTRKIASIRPVMKSSVTHGHKITRFVLNLCLVLGFTEIVGFIQIQKTVGDYSQAELTVNAIFGLCYAILRSSRGIFIVCIYIFNKRTARVLKMSMRKRFPKCFGWKGRKSSYSANTTSFGFTLATNSGESNSSSPYLTNEYRQSKTNF